MRSRRVTLKSERGAELIEFALVFPLLLFVVLGIVDFGMMFQRLEVVTNAAREGARIAVLPGYVEADVRARVCNYLQSGGVPMTTAQCALNTHITVTNVPIPLDNNTPPTKTIPGKRVGVTYSHSYMFITTFARLFGGADYLTVPVNGAAIMRDEVPVPPAAP